MNTKDFYFDLSEERIAQTPIEPRDASKLLVYNRSTKKTEHRIFRDIVAYLKPGDVLVLNDTKVIPARLYGKKEATGREVEFLLLHKINATDWQVIMRPGRKLKVGDGVVFSPNLSATILQKGKDGVCDVHFIFDGVFEERLDEVGIMPLPPYITKKLRDQTRYQTVYAKTSGSAAAPTAGLHFTPALLEAIRQKGVIIVYVLLHVGLGTFRPVKVEDIASHHMHSEYYEISDQATDAINLAKKEGRRVIAVGTTTVRTLESAADEKGFVTAKRDHTDIFIYPGYRFRVIDALITNFHLPESTLIMLVSAFASREEVLSLYQLAIDSAYRFFSFGDAMLIL